jgi:hypothetical protein
MNDMLYALTNEFLIQVSNDRGLAIVKRHDGEFEASNFDGAKLRIGPRADKVLEIAKTTTAQCRPATVINVELLKQALAHFDGAIVVYPFDREDRYGFMLTDNTTTAIIMPMFCGEDQYDRPVWESKPQPEGVIDE